jgi:spermidine synthase
MTLLGCVSPFAIRLAVTDVREAGRISGRIYAISTWGSLLGTYLPTLIIIPLAGSRITALVFGLILLGFGLYGYWTQGSPSPRARLFSLLTLPLAALSLPWATGPIKAYPGQIFETESAYNYIQVIRQEDCNYLLLNEGQAYHSFYCDGNRVPRISVWSIMLAAPYFNENAQPPDNLAVIGLAAGTIPKQYTQVFGPIPIDGIELDPHIVAAGREYFAMNEPNINVIVGDGRYQLSQLEQRYDVITLDAYKVPYIPWHLTTQEYFREVRDHLTSQGVIAVNVGRAPEDRRLVEAMTATLETVFATVHTIDVPGSLNSILVATVQPTEAASLRENLADLPAEAPPLLQSALDVAANNLVPTDPGERIVFTDQRAPVEIIVDSLVLRYLLQQGPSGLPGSGQ